MNRKCLVIISGLVFLIAVIPAASSGKLQIKQERYLHSFGGHVDSVMAKEFVVCKDCERIDRPVKKEKPLQLAVRFSESGEQQNMEIDEKKETESVIHYEKPEAVPYTVYFDFNEHTLSAEEAGKLKEIAELLMNDGYTEFEATGYADSAGTEEYNLALSRKRAERVVQILESVGVIPVKTAGLGECCSLSSDGDSRRVEVIFKRKEVK
jgi:outer membrane protein OmpA-like peptidoglycan-associated protein